MAKITKFEKDMRDVAKLEAWMSNQSREVIITLATRAALRSIPNFCQLNLGLAGRVTDQTLASILMPCLRGVSLSWTVAAYPAHAKDIVATSAYAAASAIKVDNTAGQSIYVAGAVVSANAATSATYIAYAADTTFAAATARSGADGVSAQDAAWINLGRNEEERLILARDLAKRKLWQVNQPIKIRQMWKLLQLSLPENMHWDVWTRWYEGRLEGRPANEEFELFRALQPNEFWQQEAAVINKALWDKEQEILARQKVAPEISSSPPEIPAQLPGVHVEIDSDTGKIVFTPPASLDADGNNIAKLQSFQPQIKRLTEEALGNISANEQPELRGALARYFELIDKPLAEINFDLVYAEGLFLEEAAASAERKVAQGLREPLSDAGLAALNSLNRLHPLFVLSSKAGRENLKLANEYEATKEDLASEREAEKELAAAFSEANDIVAEQTADAYEHLANSDDSSLHAERTTSARAAFTNNMVVTVATGSAIATLGTITFGAIGGPATAALLLPIYEGWKKSKAFVHVSGFVTEKIDELSEKDLLNEAQRLSKIHFNRFQDFMVEREGTLRKWAGARKSRAWVHKHLDWLKSVFKSGPKN